MIDGSLTDDRQARLRWAVANRCQSVHLVLDGLADGGNINACLRTAEGLGWLNVHIVGRSAQTNRSGRTDAGAAKWLQIKYWEKPQDCLAELIGLGLQLAGLSLAPDSRPIGELDFKQPSALILGNEHRGLSPEFAAASTAVHLPLAGLVQSYNVSVAAALAMKTVFDQRGSGHADLSPAEQKQLLADYGRRSKRPRRI